MRKSVKYLTNAEKYLFFKKKRKILLEKHEQPEFLFCVNILPEIAGLNYIWLDNKVWDDNNFWID